MSFVDDPSFGGLDLPPVNQGPAAGGTVNLPTAPFRSGPAQAPPVATPPPTPVAPTTPTTVPRTQVDPREALAEALVPVPGHPLLRKGRVTSLDVTGSVWAAYVSTEGYDDRPRRMQWNGNGSKPAVDDAVYYYNASPVPLIIGRVPTENQDQDFGTGTVTAGDYVDGSGNLRTDIDSTSGSVSSLSSTVSSHTSSISSLNSTVSGHTTTINSHTSSISSLNSTVSGHTTQISSLIGSVNFHTSQIATLNNRVFIDINAFLTEIYNRLANAESRLTAGGH